MKISFVAASASSKATLAIAAAGAVGLAIVARAAGYYAGADSIAFSITLLMGGAFAAAIAELFRVARRVAQLEAELKAFPQAPTSDHVTGATPLLRALLSARLDRAVLPVPGPVFAPFIVGTLVMLGLLGTFLGLFDTLRGAAQALTASTDVDGLRAALKAPMGGLMRGFGTSAAGVASSALLGLAMVYVRRDISLLGVNLHAMASGPLARFTPAHRQLLALERLAEQGEAWPQAAAALGEAAALLKGLEASWSRAHAEAAERTQAALRATADDIGQVVTRGIEHTASAAQAAVQPLLEATANELSQAMQSHLREVHAALARDAEQAAERAAGLHARIDSAAEQTAERDATRAALLGRAAERMQGELEQATLVVRERMQQSAETDRAQQARAEALLARVGEASAAIAASAQEHVTALQQFVEVAGERLRESEARAEGRFEALLGRIAESVDAQTSRLAGFERELVVQHAAAAEQLTERAAALAGDLTQELDQTAALVKQAATLIHGGGIELAAVADAFAAAVDKQREGARAWLESLGEVERAVVEAGEAAAAEVLGRHLSHTHEVFDRQLQFQQELIDQLRAVRHESMAQARVDAAE